MNFRGRVDVDRLLQRERRKCLFDEGAGGQGLLTIADLAWKTLFITALMAPPNQA